MYVCMYVQCMYVCLFVLFKRPNRNGETPNLYIFGILRVPRVSSQNCYFKNPIFEEVTGRFVQFGVLLRGCGPLFVQFGVSLRGCGPFFKKPNDSAIPLQKRA